MEPERIHAFLVYLTVTILLETAVLFVVGRRALRWRADELPARYLVLAGFTTSLATYPYLWFVLPGLTGSYLASHLIGEPLIILVEAGIMYGVLRVPVAHALLASAVCNATTIVTGLVLNNWEPWRRLFS